MSTTPNPALPAPATGDALLKRSRRALLATFLLLVPTILGAIYLMPTWRSIAGLSGVAFALGAGLFGLAVAGLPLAVIVALCIAAFTRVESLARPRSAPVGKLDRLLVGLAVALSAVPALWPASKAVRAVVEGSITIKQPVEHSFTASFDPLVFWENVGYWALATIALAGLAAYYWHSRWRAIRRQRRS
jgi:hypothetical protein